MSVYTILVCIHHSERTTILLIVPVVRGTRKIIDTLLGIYHMPHKWGDDCLHRDVDIFRKVPSCFNQELRIHRCLSTCTSESKRTRQCAHEPGCICPGALLCPATSLMPRPFRPQAGIVVVESLRVPHLLTYQCQLLSISRDASTQPEPVKLRNCWIM